MILTALHCVVCVCICCSHGQCHTLFCFVPTVAVADMLLTDYQDPPEAVFGCVSAFDSASFHDTPKLLSVVL